MKLVSLSISFVMTVSVITAAIAADSMERDPSTADTNPACMERDGPNCLIRVPIVPPASSFAAPPSVIESPAPLTTPVVTPAVPPSSSTTLSVPPPTPRVENAERYIPAPATSSLVVPPQNPAAVAPNAPPLVGPPAIQ